MCTTKVRSTVLGGARILILLSLLSVLSSSCTRVNSGTSVSGTSSYTFIQEPPVLSSAIELYHDGKRGVWIEETDVANLMLWINSIREVVGR